MDRIVLDYSNMLADRLDGRGIARDRLDELQERFGDVHADVQARREAGRLGFYRLPFDDDSVRLVQALADRVQQFEVLVVLGIGGSALGTTAVHRALRAPFWNELDGDARDHYPRLYVLDNVDPHTVGALLERLEPGRTLFNVISKSGSTAETLAPMLCCEGMKTIVSSPVLFSRDDRDTCRSRYRGPGSRATESARSQASGLRSLSVLPRNGVRKGEPVP